MSGKDKESTQASSTRSNILSRIDVRELKAVKVAIRRRNIPDLPNSTPPPILRSLDDPSDLVVHRRDEGQCPIFDRDDIVVNQENEERVVLTSSHTDRKQEKKHSKSPGESHSRSSSSSRKRSSSRSRSREKYSRTSRRSRSPRRSRSYSRSKDLNRKYKSDKRRSRSVSPRNRKDLFLETHRNIEPRTNPIAKSSTSQSDKYGHSSRNIGPSSSKYAERYSPPLRPGEYRPPKYRKTTISPSRLRDQKEVLDTAKPATQSSLKLRKSPYKDDSYGKSTRKENLTDKERKPVESPRREGGYRVPEKDRQRSRSPYKPREYKSDRRSRSPRDYRYGGYEKERRHSRSPRRRYERHGSPERDRRSRSPYRSEYRGKSDPRRRSRSPPHREDYRKYEYRSKRRTPSPSRKMSPPYRGPPIMAPQYKDGGLWIPDAVLASGVISGFFGPPMRPPNLKLRPGHPMPMPILHHPMYRPRPPIVYNQPYRPRQVTATVTTSTPTPVSNTASSAPVSSNLNTSTTSSASNVVTTTSEVNATTNSETEDKVPTESKL